MEKIIINDNHGLEAFLREKEPFLFEDTEVEGEIQRNVILAGFPGTGKSYAGKAFFCKCLDCESSFWHWNTEWLCDKTQPKVANKEWPTNYVDFIWQAATESRLKYILTSTHKEVLTTFNKRGFIFYIVAPLDKEESLERYRRRGSPQSFIDSLNENWDKYMKDLESYGVPVIYTNNYISDLL